MECGDTLLMPARGGSRHSISGSSSLRRIRASNLCAIVIVTTMPNGQ